MDFIRYKTLADYRGAVEGDFARDRYQNSIPLSKFAVWNEADFKAAGGLFAAVVEKGRNRAVVFHTPPYPMVVYFIDNKFDRGALDCLIKNLRGLEWEVETVWSDNASALEFAKAYSAAAGKKFAVKDRLTGYLLGGIKEIKKAEGCLRTATAADSYFLPYWAKEFAVEVGLGTDDERDLGWQIEHLAKDSSRLRVFVTPDGVPVAMVGANEVTDDCAKVGPVYTPPHFRRKGYAITAVEILCRELAKKYKDIMLFADAEYEASNACYQKLGFEKLFTTVQYKFY